MRIASGSPYGEAFRVLGKGVHAEFVPLIDDILGMLLGWIRVC
jgi:hypothetical protein